MTEAQARRACREYYLDCRPIEKIAQGLKVSKKAVREIIDDPGVQAVYLAKADGARKRTRARAAHAADLALEKQVEFLQQEVSEQLIPTQQATARGLMAAGLRDKDDRSDIRITFAGGEIPLGMPKEHAAAWTEDP